MTATATKATWRMLVLSAIIGHRMRMIMDSMCTRSLFIRMASIQEDMVVVEGTVGILSDLFITYKSLWIWK